MIQGESKMSKSANAALVSSTPLVFDFQPEAQKLKFSFEISNNA